MGKNISHRANFNEPIGSCKFGLSNKNSSKLIGLNGLQSYLREKIFLIEKRQNLLRFSVYNLFTYLDQLYQDSKLMFF